MQTTPTQIKDSVRNFIINDLLFGQGNFADSDSFLEHGIIDSTGVLELVGHIEGTFDFKLDNADLTPENLDSVEKIGAFVSRKLASAG